MKQIFTKPATRFRAVFLIATVASIISRVASAQAPTETNVARQYVVDNARQQNLTPADVNGMSVSSAYVSPTTGWQHVYFNQNHLAVDVYNRLANLTLVNGKVSYMTHNLVQDLASKVVNKTLKSKISPLDALQKATASVNLTTSNLAGLQPITTKTLTDGTLVGATYRDASLSNEPIDIRMYWLPQEESADRKTKEVVTLTWLVRFMTKNSQNAWSIHVDAESSEIVRTVDEVVHCNFDAPNSVQTSQACNTPGHAHTGATDGVRAFGSKNFIANSYTIFDYGIESPNHGSRTVSTNPYTRFAPSGAGPGTTNGWHNDGTTNYTNTRGNNVWAQEDVNANDGTGASPASPTLEFDYPFTSGLNTAAGNQNAAITNLFYWNNLIHDVLWRFGFDEPSGNFQANNQGRGGAGNDFVYADAQDGAGTNNANFSTPPDGGNGRMQMFLWTNTGGGYQPDGDFDNGIIAHEYGHGWSIRLTGGPANSSCLQNAEQGGEGWSDYLGLMLTTPWSTLSPNVASANIPRGIGTYAQGQPTTGNGIRPYRYSYDMANVNGPVTYAGVGNTLTFSRPHGIGSIWATMLWDMTWEIIMQDNFIAANVYSIPANVIDMRGNVAALKLVNEGLRMQPCSPGFIQARDAILQADQMLFGGRYNCAIWRAFARRGLGLNASTGASTDDRIVTEDFTPGPSVLTSATSATTCSNAVFAYTATSNVSGATFSWTRAAVAGISNPAGSNNSAVINETLVNTTQSPITVIYTFSISPSPCGPGSISQPVRVTVNPTPSVVNYAICQNAAVPAGEGLVVQLTTSATYNGTITTASGTYNRASGNNATVYSASGNNTYFHTYTFVASSTTSVTFETIAATLSTGSDTYLSLYQTSFNPASPATNFLHGDDDSGDGLLSAFTHALTQGTTYVIVTTTYSAGYTGSFTLRTSTPVFKPSPSWYSTLTGGSVLSTADVFNPVGVPGSGITNTATPAVTPFYVAISDYPACRQTGLFTIISTVPPVATGATIPPGSSVSLTATGCTGGVLKWYQASDNAEVSMPVSPATTTQYYARCQQTVDGRVCLSDNSNIVSVTVSANATFDSATSGNWNVASTWVCNCVPDGTRPVRIMSTHTVTVPTAYTGLAQKVTYTGSGKLIFQSNSQVNITN